MYIVENNTKSVHACYMTNPDSKAAPGAFVRLLPGTNPVPDAEWEAVNTEGSMVRRMLEEFVTDDGRPMLTAEKIGGDFKAMPASKAIAFVRRSADLALLKSHLMTETRPNVAEELKKRIEKITPSSAEKKPDGDDVDADG